MLRAGCRAGLTRGARPENELIRALGDWDADQVAEQHPPLTVARGWRVFVAALEMLADDAKRVGVAGKIALHLA